MRIDNYSTMRRAFLFLFLLITGVVFHSFAEDSAPADTLPAFYVINIDSEINTTSRIILRKGLDEANRSDVKAILLHLNTYGGTVVDADSMRSAILYNPVPVYVFIDNNAASAGALISIACEKVFMRKGANIGAVTVVSGESGEAMPDKYQSYMRSMMRSTAEARGRDPLIAEAMVDDRIVIPGISEEGKTLTFTAQEALTHGFCDGIAEDLDEVITNLLDYPQYELKEYKPTFLDKLKGFLTNPAFQAILIMIIVAGIYFELQSPGIGFPSAAAIIAAVLYFTPLYLDGLVQHWEVIVFILGLLLVLLEIFVIPGFGVAGITGIIFVATGFVFAMLDNDYFNFERVEIPDISGAVLTVLSGILLSFAIILWLSSRIGKKGMFRRISLDADLTTSQSVDKNEFGLVGQQGKSMTDLRPSGRVMIANEVYDAVSIHGYIEKGNPIVVVKFENMQLYVESI